MVPLAACLVGVAVAFSVLGWLSRKWIVQDDLRRLRRKNLELASESAELTVARDELRARAQRLNELEVEVALSGETRSILEKRLREVENRLASVLRDRDADNSRINSHLAEISVLKAILAERDTQISALESRPPATVVVAADPAPQLAEAEQAFRVLLEEKEARIAELETDNAELREVRGGFFDAVLADKDAQLNELRAEIVHLQTELAETSEQLRLGHARTLSLAASAGGSRSSFISLPDLAVSPPVVADPLSPAELAGRLESLLFDQRIEFTPHTAHLADHASQLLIEIAELLVRCPQASLRLEGHTDSAGDANSNWQLSHARAYAVRDYLTDCGLPAHRFTCVGYGDTRPLDENHTEDGRWRNRRVEFRVLPPR